MFQISQANFRRRLTLALVLPLVLMSLLAATFIWQVNNLISVMQWVDRTDQVIARAHYTEKLLVDMETGLRGYLVTGNSEFLEPYERAQLAIDSSFNQLGGLISNKRPQMERLNTVRSLYEQWEPYAQQMIARRVQGSDYQSYALNAEGKQRMDAIRVQITSFVQFEEGLRKQRIQDVRRTTRFVISTTIVLLLGIGGILALFIRRQLMAVSQNYGLALKSAQEQAAALQENEEALRRSAQRLAGLHDIDRDILAAKSLEGLVGAALSRMRQLVRCQQAFVVLFDFETGTARVASRVNGELNLPESAALPLADFVSVEATPLETRYVEDIATTESCLPALKRLLLDGACSYITVPLLAEDNLIGELNLVATQKAAFSAEYRQISEEVAAQLAIAIQQSRLREQLQRYTVELEQRVAERTRKLQEANSELEAFSYSVSHDLRAPLRTLQGFTQALLEDYGSQLDSIGQEYAQYIVESAVQMDVLIADLLDYSRLSRAEIQLQPLDLSNLVAQVLSQLDAQLREQQAVVNVEEPLPQVMAQRSTLAQVLTNLLANAVKFVALGVQPQVRLWAEEIESREGREAGEAGGEVFTNIGGQYPPTSLTPENSSPASPASSAPPTTYCIRLWVEDNGIGIASEYHERIFRVFERLHGVETYPGTGIGLAIVRKGMERLGGRVGLESQPHGGSRFWIELPKVSS